MSADVREDQNSQIVNESYELVPVGDLTEHPDNPRKGNTEAIAQSVDANGFFGTVTVQKSTGFIIDGNHRWKAAKARGMKSVPVVWADVDDATARRILLAANRTNDLATYDDEALASMLSEIRDAGDLYGTGYDDAAVDKLLEKITDAPMPEGDADSTDLLNAYGVVVECDNESQQSALLERLDAEGFRVRALVGG